MFTAVLSANSPSNSAATAVAPATGTQGSSASAATLASIISSSVGDDAAMAARTIDIVGRPMPPLDFVGGGKAGALADQASETPSTPTKPTKHTWAWWRRVLSLAALWALIVSVVVGGVSFLFSPLLSSDTAQGIVWNWKVPLYNAVLSGVLTIALSTALAAVPRD